MNPPSHPPADTFHRVVDALKMAGIPHMLVGSLASAAHSVPRATYDIDFVINPTPASLDIFISRFDPEHVYVGPAPHDALRQRDQFNLIDTDTDFVILRDRPFDQAEFTRRSITTIDDIEVFVASPEDVVLSKLVWAAQGGSARQVEDAAAVLAAKRDVLDNKYLDRWAAELGVTELLARARQ